MTVTTKTIEELEEMEARIKRALDVIESSDDEEAVRAGKAMHRDLTDLRGSFPDWPVPEGGGNK